MKRILFSLVVLALVAFCFLGLGRMFELTYMAAHHPKPQFQVRVMASADGTRYYQSTEQQ